MRRHCTTPALCLTFLCFWKVTSMIPAWPITQVSLEKALMAKHSRKSSNCSKCVYKNKSWESHLRKSITPQMLSRQGMNTPSRRIVVMMVVKVTVVKISKMVKVMEMTAVKMVRVPSMPILTIAVCSGAFFGFSPISISCRKCKAITRITTTVIVIIVHLRNDLHISTSHLWYWQCLVFRCWQKGFREQYRSNFNCNKPTSNLGFLGVWAWEQSKAQGPRS